MKVLLVGILAAAALIVSFSAKGDVQSIPQEAVQDSLALGVDGLWLVGDVMKRTFDSDSADPEAVEMCSLWEISADQLQGVLALMRPATSEEHNAQCYFFPCTYEGVARTEDAEYEIHIGLGSNIVLRGARETMYYISESAFSPFLVSCDCCE
jgi:hypothetical protein